MSARKMSLSLAASRAIAPMRSLSVVVATASPLASDVRYWPSSMVPPATSFVSPATRTAHALPAAAASVSWRTPRMLSVAAAATATWPSELILTNLYCFADRSASAVKLVSIAEPPSTAMCSSLADCSAQPVDAVSNRLPTNAGEPDFGHVLFARPGVQIRVFLEDSRDPVELIARFELRAGLVDVGPSADDLLHERVGRRVLAFDAGADFLEDARRLQLERRCVLVGHPGLERGFGKRGVHLFAERRVLVGIARPLLRDDVVAVVANPSALFERRDTSGRRFERLRYGLRTRLLGFGAAFGLRRGRRL